MFDNWTVGRRLAAGFALAGLTLLVIAVVAYRTTSGLIENNDLVSHTHQVRNGFANLLSVLKDAETGQRGYVLTGIDSYLEPYQSAVTTIKAVSEDVRKLTADNPDQQRRLAALADLIDAKMAELKLTIDLRKDSGFDAALREIGGGKGKSVMDQIRATVAAADQEELNLLQKRNDQA